MDFVIYYGDGTTFSGRPEDAPSENVQCIAWNDETKGPADLGRVVLHQYDIYIYSDGVGWHGTNKYADLMRYLGRGCGVGGVRAVLSGEWLSRPKFDEILRKAETEPGLQPKSARDPMREDGAA